MTCSAMAASALLLFALISPPQAATVEIREVLTLGPVGSGGRVPIATNALVDRLVRGPFVPPVEGGVLAERTWTKATAGADGAIQSRAFRGGFAFASVRSEVERVMMLEAAGHSYVYVNGEPRGGDPYSFGFVRHAVLLKKGENSFLFNVGRGSLRAKLVAPESDRLFIEARDSTMPDVIVGEAGELWGSVIVTNPTTSGVSGARIVAQLGDGEHVDTTLGVMEPLISVKVPIHFIVPASLSLGKARLSVRIVHPIDRQPSVSEMTIELDVRPLSDNHKRTFVSGVDGSVQYYAVRPPFEKNIATADALVLTVHGAGVEATGQAAAYGAKSWAWIVAPTNRRPYGFDWEDWGRIDAMEALADAKRRYMPREDRIYLTGHSMGGHGAWYLGATHPDQWGAIGPAAGWPTFWSYGGAVRYADPDPIEAMLLRAANVSDVMKLQRNFLQHGVFVLHGDADQTVSVNLARQMRTSLSTFHRDLDWHEEPGGGHWYDNTPEPGADCVDYGPMFEFFDKRRRRLSNEVRRVEFTSVCPQVSATSHWVTIAQQETPLVPSSVVAVNPIGTQRVEVQTTNVAFLVLDIGSSPMSATDPIDVSINGTEIKAVGPTDGRVWLEKSAGGWHAVGALPRAHKSPERGGPFKSAFNNRFVLVYGTTGTPEENAWSYAKARYDAETWWYRGNGTATIMSDRDFGMVNVTNGPRGRMVTTNIVAYGNESTNSIVRDMLSRSEVRVGSSTFQAQDRKLTGTDLSVLMVVPAWGESASVPQRLVAIVGGTGIVGMRGTDLMPYFVSGVHYPDLFVYDSRIHSIGSKAVRAAGYFGNDWSVENGDIAWRD